MEESLAGLPALGDGGRRRSSRLQAAAAGHRDSSDSPTFDTPADRSARSTPVFQSSRSTPGDKSSRATPHEDKNNEHTDHDSTPGKRVGLRWRNEASKIAAPDPMEAAMKPLTDEERRSWPGWVELESDPALFNYILREYGVKDVKVQEVLGLDDEMLTFLPKPVYGLIFLFRYRDDDEEEEEDIPKCPNHVWFANQTITNACATIALLNIIMNIPKINLGENLNVFKTETRGLKPAYRGQRLGNDDFIRNIHNSFARRMDMLNADLALSNEIDKWERAKNNKKKKGAKKHNAKKKKADEEESGFHFIAYVPIQGVVWTLDGLQRQPVNLGEFEEDWIAVARANIYQRIGQYDEDGLQFNLLSLCKSPLLTIPENLAENIRSTSAVEKALATALPDWRQFLEHNQTSLAAELNNTYGLSKEVIVNSHVPDSVNKRLKEAITDPSTLMDFRLELLAEQNRLQMFYMEEVALIGQENEQAARRKVDYTPIIYNSIKTLAENGILKEIIRDLRETEDMMG